MINHYRIIKHTYYEKCEVKNHYFTIQQKWMFLRWPFWFTLKQLYCGWGDCYKSHIKFDTESEAIYAIKKLQSGNIADGWVEQVSTELDFTKNENK